MARSLPLRYVAYNNILPISDFGHRGRVLRLVFSRLSMLKAVKYFINKKGKAVKRAGQQPRIY